MFWKLFFPTEVQASRSLLLRLLQGVSVATVILLEGPGADRAVYSSTMTNVVCVVCSCTVSNQRWIRLLRVLPGGGYMKRKQITVELVKSNKIIAPNLLLSMQFKTNLGISLFFSLILGFITHPLGSLSTAATLNTWSSISLKYPVRKSPR